MNDKTSGYTRGQFSIDRVTRGTPARHMIHDSESDCSYDTVDGLAFTIGVAAIEAEIAHDPARVFTVCHPNGVKLYIVTYTYGQIIITKMAGV